jgi:hypothetical protein
MGKFTNLTLVLTIVFVLAVLSSCKKEEEKAVYIAKVDKKLFLAGQTSKNWQINKFISGGRDKTNTIPLCEVDDLKTFFVDTRYHENPNEFLCDTINDQLEIGRWSFSNNEQMLNLTINNETTTAEIQALTATSLVLKTYSQGVSEEYYYIPRD